MNKWTRPFEGNNASAAPAGPGLAPAAHHYFAFLSYAHADSADADWLHQELERFRVPSSLAGRLTANGVIPRRLTPIFRDRHELAASHDLGAEIRQALELSRALIVLCSPAAAKSKWVNAEVDQFKRIHPEGCIIAAVVAGEPLASDIPGREEEECFPPALIAKYNRRGKPTGQKTEPLAADLREGKGGRRIGFLKVVAGILGVGLDDLVQREHLRHQRRLALISGGSLVGMLMAAALAFAAIQARDAARDQRREAEGLVAFMVGDLKDKLQPIGRLDVLDGVGSRVLQYYGTQDASQLSDQGLAQRSKALTLMGQIARDRGNLDRAYALYRAAYAGTTESIRRKPDDPQRLFEHAQNAFYLADIALRRGQLSTAENLFRDYKNLAGRMVAIDPDNIRWRMEAQYAAANLGIVLHTERRFAEALQQFESALGTIKALATADPDNNEYQLGVAEALAWLADAQEADGRLTAAIQSREQHVKLLERLIPRNGADARFRLIPAHRGLGALYAERGEGQRALQQYRLAMAQGAALVALDSANSKWLESTETTRLRFARQLLEMGEAQEAAGQTATACQAFQRLAAADPTAFARKAGVRDCLLMRAQLALHSGATQEAANLSIRAVQAAKSVKSSDLVDDRFAIARTYQLLGDVRRRLGDQAAARAAWQDGIGAIPSGIAKKPSEMAQEAILLTRLGRVAEANQRLRRLNEVGYREKQSN